jgi:hypothetical protein
MQYKYELTRRFCPQGPWCEIQDMHAETWWGIGLKTVNWKTTKERKRWISGTYVFWIGTNWNPSGSYPNDFDISGVQPSRYTFQTVFSRKTLFNLSERTVSMKRTFSFIVFQWVFLNPLETPSSQQPVAQDNATEFNWIWPLVTFRNHLRFQQIKEI